MGCAMSSRVRPTKEKGSRVELDGVQIHLKDTTPVPDVSRTTILSLPTELLLEIVEYTISTAPRSATRERAAQVARLTLVCRRWRDAVEGCPMLWTEPPMDVPSAIERSVRCSKGLPLQVTYAHTSRWRQNSPRKQVLDGLRKVLATCALSELHLDMDRDSVDAVLVGISLSGALRELHIRSNNNLTFRRLPEIYLDNDTEVDDDTHGPLFTTDATAGSYSLILSDSQLTSLHLERYLVPHMPLPATIRHLTLTHPDAELSASSLMRLLRSLPDLCSLVLRHAVQGAEIPNMGLTERIALPRLDTIRLFGDRNEDVLPITSILHLPALRSIYVGLSDQPAFEQGAAYMLLEALREVAHECRWDLNTIGMLRIGVPEEHGWVSLTMAPLGEHPGFSMGVEYGSRYEDDEDTISTQALDMFPTIGNISTLEVNTAECNPTAFIRRLPGLRSLSVRGSETWVVETLFTTHVSSITSLSLTKTQANPQQGLWKVVTAALHWKQVHGGPLSSLTLCGYDDLRAVFGGAYARLEELLHEDGLFVEQKQITTDINHPGANQVCT